MTITASPTNRRFQPEALKPPRCSEALHRERVHRLMQETPWQIHLEIGAGKGMHALQWAENNPDKTLIAIERTAEKYQVFAERAATQALRNLIPVHADAIPYLVHYIPPASVTACFILYPNPEPHNPAQRWVNMPFFEFLLSRLCPLSQIYLASNIPAYLDEAENRLKEVWQLPYQRYAIDESFLSLSAGHRKWPCDNTHPGRTHFERKYLLRGEPCGELSITKPAGHTTHFDNWLPKVTANPGVTGEQGFQAF